MKKKIAVIALLLLTVFSLIGLNSSKTEVRACDAPLPHADLPEPVTCD